MMYSLMHMNSETTHVYAQNNNTENCTVWHICNSIYAHNLDPWCKSHVYIVTNVHAPHNRAQRSAFVTLNFLMLRLFRGKNVAFWMELPTSWSNPSLRLLLLASFFFPWYGQVHAFLVRNFRKFVSNLEKGNPFGTWPRDFQRVIPKEHVLMEVVCNSHTSPSDCLCHLPLQTSPNQSGVERGHQTLTSHAVMWGKEGGNLR